MFKIAICDDAPIICEEIQRIILGNKKDLSCENVAVNIFYIGEVLVNELRDKSKFDLILLDIELGSINGVEVGHLICEELEDYITNLYTYPLKIHMTDSYLMFNLFIFYKNLLTKKNC